MMRKDERAKSLGVTIEAQYTVGEYDILILSAKQSDGLETWLVESGYTIPRGASAVLGSYIRQNMKFFVAKVNLKEQAKLGFSYLRPIQVAYESPKFMLPIRLGTVNAKGTQELFVYLLTRKGRVETTNYRTVKLPSDVDVPIYVKEDFGPFYKATFAQAVRKEDMTAVFAEYAWDMNWCDPCAADPLSQDELKRLGVFWMGGGDGNGGPARTRSSPAFMSATTATTSPRTWSSRRPATDRTSRPATSSITRGPALRSAMPARPTDARCANARRRRPRTWPASPAGASATSAGR